MIRIENGKVIPCTETEVAHLQLRSEMNKKYPEYHMYLKYDGVNAPTYDMEALKKGFQSKVKNAAQKAMTDLTAKIEIAQEDGETETEKELLKQRKALRCIDIVMSEVKSIDDLQGLIPESLKKYM